MIRFWANAMSRAFTGLSIEQLHHAESISGKIQELHRQVPPILLKLDKALTRCGVEDFETNGYSVQCGRRALDAIQRGAETRSLWDQYMHLAGLINGLRGDAPTQSFPVYQYG